MLYVLNIQMEMCSVTTTFSFSTYLYMASLEGKHKYHKMPTVPDIPVQLMRPGMKYVLHIE